MTSSDAEAALVSRQLREILPGGASGAVRRIGVDDDRLLSPREHACLRHAVAARRRASGAARLLARCLLGDDLAPDIPWSPVGAPVWPAGVVGSLAHDESMAAAVLGPAAGFAGLGIDLEPAGAFDEELTAAVASADEQRAFAREQCRGEVLFCVKEAVFKAVHPVDGRFLEFGDIAVDRDTGMATTGYGRRLQWRAAVGPRVLAVAWWRHS